MHAALTVARNHGIHTDYIKQYYFEESGSVFKRTSHNHRSVNWQEFRMPVSCLEHKPVPIFTASNAQKCAIFIHADTQCDLQTKCEYEIIQWSTTEDPLRIHTYFLFGYAEDVVSTILISDVYSDVSLACFGLDVQAAARNSTISHCTSGDNKEIVTSKNNSQTILSDDSFQVDENFTPLTNNPNFAYFNFEDDAKISVRDSSKVITIALRIISGITKQY